MSLFPETIRYGLAGGKVEWEPLARFNFASSTMRLWRGQTALKTGDGERWLPLRLGSLAGIEQAVNGEAPMATFTLSAIDAQIQQTAREEWRAECKGRLVQVYLQFFGVDDPADPGNQRALDLPVAVWAGRMQAPTFPFEEDGSRSVQIEAESLYSLRTRPQYAMYTDADQQHRFAGDKGFEFVASLVNKVVTWPDW